MRTLVVAAVTVAVVALLGGCSGDGSNEADDAASTASVEPSPEDPETTADPSPRSGDDAVFDSEACDAVRAGIDAFNAGALAETVEQFQEALPLAEAQDDGSVTASQLIEAVRYYAELDAELYPDAAQSSPDFAKYKAITLGQCVAAGEATEPPGEAI